MADARELYFQAPRLVTVDPEEALRFGETFIWDLTEPNPTDEPCVFCDEPTDESKVSAFDISVPIASGQVALKGAMGMLRPGYMLGVTREHTTSFAQLSKAALAEIDGAFDMTERQLSSSLRQEGYLRLEHGSDNVGSCGLGAGACVVHAHQHLIPIARATGEHMLAQDVGWHELDDYASLADLRGNPYLYIGFSGKHYAAVDPKVRSQWGRRVIAAADGHDEWDWAVFSGAINLLQTFISQGTLPQGRVIFSQDGPAVFEPRMNLRGRLYK